jgi:hypothetical protein
MLPRDAISSVRGVLPVMTRVDEQEVPSVGEINVPKRRLKTFFIILKRPPDHARSLTTRTDQSNSTNLPSSGRTGGTP